MATTYMSLSLPTVSVTFGPAWATALNAAFEAVDSHDHTDGKGTQISPAGININDTLDFNSKDASNLRSARFIPQTIALATSVDKRCIYAVGGNLYWNNENGTAVQITSGTSVVSAGSGAWSSTTPGAYPYSATTADAQRVILVDSSAARTLNLPAATDVLYCIVKDAGGLAQTNNISVAPNGTDTIEGVNASFALNENYCARGFISDGVSAWYVV
jgi:hypothetical protein